MGSGNSSITSYENFKENKQDNLDKSLQPDDLDLTLAINELARCFKTMDSEILRLKKELETCKQIIIENDKMIELFKQSTNSKHPLLEQKR